MKFDPDGIQKLTNELREIPFEVGQCIHSWSWVERGMSDLFMSLHNHPESVLRHVFEGVQSFEVRLAMLNITVTKDAHIPPLFKARWNSLHNKIARMVKKRNAIAHFLIVQVQTGDVPVARLFPFFSLTGVSTATTPTPLSSDDIKARKRSFDQLARRIDRFISYIEITRGRREVGSLPITDPDHLLDNPFVPTPKGIESQPQSSLA